MTDPETPTAAEIFAAVGNIEVFATRLAGIVALAPKMKGLASLLGAEQEIRTKVADLQARAAELGAARDADIRAADLAHQRHAKIAGELASHDLAMSAAREEALNRARDEAAHIIANARAEVGQMVKDGRSAIDADSRARVARDEAEIAARQAVLAKLAAEIDDKRETLATVTAALGSLRTKIGP
jgi:DNA repair exonuclease SbcCD ATPase subunit